MAAVFVCLLFFQPLYQHTFETISCLLNKFFRNFIPFLLNSSLKRTNIWMKSCICFVFWNAPISAIKGVRSGLDGGHKETTVISEIFFLPCFGVKRIIDFLSFIFSCPLILGWILMKTCLNNRANQETLDSSRSFPKLD